MTKLSKAQLAILRRMGEGGVLEYAGGYVDRHAWRAGGGPRLNRTGIQTLQNLGLVKATPWRWWGWSYNLTPAGRTYLEELSDDQP